MRPEVAKAHADLEAAKKRLRQVLQDEARAVVPLVACRLCKAPVGHPCAKGLWPHGKKTRPHAERRRDADRA